MSVTLILIYVVYLERNFTPTVYIYVKDFALERCYGTLKNAGLKTTQVGLNMDKPSGSVKDVI